MKHIEPFAVYQQSAKVYLLEFSLEKGTYEQVGIYDYFYSSEEQAVFSDAASPYFSAVFFHEKKVYKAIKGKFVGFGSGLIYFENDKGLSVVHSNGSISELEVSKIEEGKWANDHLLFESCPSDKSVVMKSR